MKFRHIGLELAKRGYVSMGMEYRLSGEAHFPANIHDCHAAVRYLRANAKEYNLDPDRIGVIGGSAGGHLAGLLATTSKVKSLHGNGGNEKFSSEIQAAVVMSGPMRISTGRVAEKSMQINNAQSFAVKLFGGTIQQLPQQYEAADAHLHIDKDTPPILFQYGGAEDPSEIEPTVEKLEKLEIPVEVLTHYKDGKHGCWNSKPWFMPMMEDIDAWFQEHL
jgi:pectinesterase